MWGFLRRIFSSSPSPAPAPTPAPAAPKPLPVAAPAWLGKLLAYHSIFDARLRWCVTSRGVQIEGEASPRRTPGVPATVHKTVEWFKHDIRESAKAYNVPAELIIACICTESTGRAKKREDAAFARREEPGFVSDTATPGRVSIGPMQTLIATAREALKDPRIGTVQLLDPAVSIKAGTAYIAQQFAKTGYDPPLVAAAYNAGGVYDDPVPGLPFSLRDFPAGSDSHVERFVAWFGDAMAVVAEDPAFWAGVPTFNNYLRR